MEEGSDRKGMSVPLALDANYIQINALIALIENAMAIVDLEKDKLL